MAIGKVIKGEGLPEPLGDKSAVRPRAGVVSAETYDAKQEAEQIRAEAKRQAAAMLQEARAQCEAEKQNARQAGLEQGKAEANEYLLKAKLQVGQLLDGAEKEIVALALTACAKIIGQDLQRDPTLIAKIAATAIETVRGAKAVTIRVHPEMGAKLRGLDPTFAAFAAALGKNIDIQLRDDPDVEPEGCVIQTEFGVIDAQLTTQIRMLHNVLLPDDGKSEGPA